MNTEIGTIKIGSLSGDLMKMSRSSKERFLASISVLVLVVKKSLVIDIVGLVL